MKNLSDLKPIRNLILLPAVTRELVPVIRSTYPAAVERGYPLGVMGRVIVRDFLANAEGVGITELSDKFWAALARGLDVPISVVTDFDGKTVRTICAARRARHVMHKAQHDIQEANVRKDRAAADLHKHLDQLPDEATASVYEVTP